MIVLKILLIILIVFVALFLLSLIIYFFNLDMKGAAVLMKLLEGLYDKRKKKQDAGQTAEKK